MAQIIVFLQLNTHKFYDFTIMKYIYYNLIYYCKLLNFPNLGTNETFLSNV
jgi:hypothetical protein